MKLESLEELRVFTQIVESGSMAAAARALGIPTSTVSRRLAGLEGRLGQTLLYRTTRSLSVGEAGRALLARARRILDEASAAELALERASEGLAGLVRIGVPSVLARDLLTGLAPALIEHPGLRLQISIHDRPVNPVSEGLDAVIMGGALDDSTLIARKLGEVRLVLAAKRDYLERRGRPKRPADLIDHNTLHFLRDPPVSFWELYDTSGECHQVAIEVTLEANDGRALLDAIRAGIGIGTTSERLLRSSPDLERVLPGFAFHPFPVFAVYPTAGRRSGRLQEIVRVLQLAMV